MKKKIKTRYLKCLKTRSINNPKKESNHTFWKDILIPCFSLIVALSGVGVGAFFQNKATETQIQTTKYQVTYDSKLQGYSEFMSRLSDVYIKSAYYDAIQSNDSISNLDKAFFSLDPLLPKDVSDDILFTLAEYEKVCLDISKLKIETGSISDEKIIFALGRQQIIRDKIRKELFE